MRLAIAAVPATQYARASSVASEPRSWEQIKFCPRDTIPHIDYAAVVAFHTQVEEGHAGRFSGPHDAL
jgi:hypothetical protein